MGWLPIVVGVPARGVDCARVCPICCSLALFACSIVGAGPPRPLLHPFRTASAGRTSLLLFMNPAEYKESLQQAAAALLTIREHLFDAIFQVAIIGELKEWSDTVADGVQVTFPKALFEACEDANVRLLTHLLNNVEHTRDSLLNLNNLAWEDE